MVGLSLSCPVVCCDRFRCSHGGALSLGIIVGRAGSYAICGLDFAGQTGSGTGNADAILCAVAYVLRVRHAPGPAAHSPGSVLRLWYALYSGTDGPSYFRCSSRRRALATQAQSRALALAGGGLEIHAIAISTDGDRGYGHRGRCWSIPTLAHWHTSGVLSGAADRLSPQSACRRQQNPMSLLPLRRTYEPPRPNPARPRPHALPPDPRA